MKSAILTESNNPLVVADIELPKKNRVWASFGKNML